MVAGERRGCIDRADDARPDLDRAGRRLLLREAECLSKATRGDVMSTNRPTGEVILKQSFAKRISMVNAVTVGVAAALAKD